jgi:hypothetical protein
VSAPVEDEALAAFQDALVEGMMLELPAHELMQRLRDDPRATPFAEYLASLDARCVEITSRLMRRWADRAPEGTLA